MSLNQRRALILGSIFAGVTIIAYFIIKLASGYQPDFSTKSLKPTGLLVATSTPDGAQIFVNAKLKSATNATISLTPGEYEVEIRKDGYFAWKKHLIIKKELVTKADVTLFPSFPDLRVLTFTGAKDPVLSPDGQKVAYSVATASAGKQGLWVLDLENRPLGLAFPRDPRQVLSGKIGIYTWSPDSKQLLINSANKENYLIDASRLNPTTALVDMTPNLPALKQRFLAEEEQKLAAQMAKLPTKLTEIIVPAIADIKFSPDETKILYTATASATLPDNLLPTLPVTSTQKQARNLETGKIYAYDLKEDTNFLITEAPTKKVQKIITWFPTSKHIFMVQSGKISIMDYDGTNIQDVYSGPFENSFAFPFPDGSRLLVLASLGKDTPPNLYAISLR